jgi:hypothetical protein
MRMAQLLRAHAQEAQRMAKVSRESDRKVLIAVARDWFRAAEQLERGLPIKAQHQRLPSPLTVSASAPCVTESTSRETSVDFLSRGPQFVAPP